MAQPKGPLAHMARQTWTKFTKNAKASRRLVPKDRWTHPKDRVAHWKIMVGDSVSSFFFRIMGITLSSSHGIVIDPHLFTG